MTLRKRPPWLDEVVSESIADARRLPWGFTNESWLVTRSDGRRIVVTRYRDGRPGERTPALATVLRPRLSAAGLPTPVVDLDLSNGRADVIVTEYIDGDAGAALLSVASGPRLVGTVAGRAWRSLQSVDPSGLDVPRLWSEPDRLVERATLWAGRLTSELTDGEVANLAAAIVALPTLLRGRSSSLVHGDLVPVNILIRDGRLAALLDLGSTRIGDPLLDAAWFRWIVRYHHRAESVAAWAGFRDGASLDNSSPPTRSLLDRLPSLRILELIDPLPADSPARARWLDQLRASLRPE